MADSSAAAASNEAPALEASGIGKHFAGVIALDDADFSCRRGEVHVLLGANGAGKSTLVKILCGVQPPDAGTLRLNGETVRLHNPIQAAELGVAAVFQELSLAPHLTVAENIMLAHEPTGPFGQIRSRELRRRVIDLFEQIGIDHINPNTLAGRLTLADQQLVEIAKALSHDPKTLILDEGTSALGREEVRRLFDLIARLRERGTAIVFISHRMAEVREIADRLTVFRNGTNVGTVDAVDMDESHLVELMLGERIEQSFPDRAPMPTDKEPLLAVSDLNAGELLHDISLEIRRGEVVGLAGLEGQGQGDLLLALFGMVRRLSGEVRVNGKPTHLGSPWKAIKAGFALIPEDRKTQGLLQPLSLRENIVLASLHRLTRGGLIDRSRERRAAEQGMKRLEIKAESMETPVVTLSGGNQQKVVIAKWLETGGDIFLFYDPTRGVDVGTKRAFYELIGELARAGKAVLLYSTELSELVGLCHRVLVMNDRRIAEILEGESITENTILAASLGVGDRHSANTEPATDHRKAGAAS